MISKTPTTSPSAFAAGDRLIATAEGEASFSIVSSGEPSSPTSLAGAMDSFGARVRIDADRVKNVPRDTSSKATREAVISIAGRFIALARCAAGYGRGKRIAAIPYAIDICEELVRLQPDPLNPRIASRHRGARLAGSRGVGVHAH